jgi:hypothetical protein
MRNPGSMALMAGVAVALAAWGGGIPASAAARPAILRTVEFGYVGPYEQYAIAPAGATSAAISVIGAMGGTAVGSDRVTGGDGAEVRGVIPVHPGEDFALKVGEYGGNSDGPFAGPGGWGATGDGGAGGEGFNDAGAGGGGASSLAIRSTGFTVVVAGGGGGAGGRGFYNGGPGGTSGATVDPGHNGRGPGAGKGGGGAANGVPEGGEGGTGLHMSGSGGGGGAGALGGGGGSGGGFGAGGGGGGGAGSSHFAPELGAPSVGRGSTVSGNGLIVITFS